MGRLTTGTILPSGRCRPGRQVLRPSMGRRFAERRPGRSSESRATRWRRRPKRTTVAANFTGPRPTGKSGDHDPLDIPPIPQGHPPSKSASRLLSPSYSRSGYGTTGSPAGRHRSSATTMTSASMKGALFAIARPDRDPRASSSWPNPIESIGERLWGRWTARRREERARSPEVAVRMAFAFAVCPPDSSAGRLVRSSLLALSRGTSLGLHAARFCVQRLSQPRPPALPPATADRPRPTRNLQAVYPGKELSYPIERLPASTGRGYVSTGASGASSAGRTTSAGSGFVGLTPRSRSCSAWRTRFPGPSPSFLRAPS